MSFIVKKALESLMLEVFPKLLESFESVNTKPELELTPEFIALLEEGRSLLEVCLNGQEPPKVGDMSDDDARMLLMEMDGGSQVENSASSASSTQNESHPSGSMNDDEALRLLAAMDSPATNSSPGGGAQVKSSEAAEHITSLPPAEVVEEIEEWAESGIDIEPEMTVDFVNSAQELIQALDDKILELETAANPKELMEEIFRSAHTLKGGAGMFGYKAMERIMHRMENFFDQVRKGKKTITTNVVDVIFSGLDLVRKLLDGVKAGAQTGIKTAKIVENLNAICEGKEVVGVKKSQEETPTSENSKTEDSATSAAADQPSTPSAAGAGPKKAAIEQASIRVDLKRLDSLVNMVGELVVDRTKFVNIHEQMKNEMTHGLLSNLAETVQIFTRHMNEIQETIMKVRMVPISQAFNKYPRILRDLSKSLNKEIDLVIEGENTELDKTIVEQIGDPLIHLIRNAADHGIEMPDDRSKKGKSRKGQILLGARQEGNQIVITISDDGKGMDKEVIRKKGIEKGLLSEGSTVSDQEIFNLIFESGFSTAAKVTAVSGRGVGMDVVRSQIQKLKGTVNIFSEPDKGSTIEILLPLTLAIVKSLLVKSGDETFAIPLSNISESIMIRLNELERVGVLPVIRRREQVVPVFSLNNLLLGARDLSLSDFNTHEKCYLVIVQNLDKKFGLLVDELLNQQEMVIKSLGKLVPEHQCLSGGSILGDGSVVLALDVVGLAHEMKTFQRNHS